LAQGEIAAWREETVRILDPKLSRDQVLGMLDHVPISKSRPPYETILLDRSGNLWVKLGPTAGATSESVDFLVFDPEGVLLGEVVLPNIQVLEIGDDYVLGVYRDELEIQYVQVHDLVK
jgi:hypothetical protein